MSHTILASQSEIVRNLQLAQAASRAVEQSFHSYTPWAFSARASAARVCHSVLEDEQLCSRATLTPVGSGAGDDEKGWGTQYTSTVLLTPPP